MDNLSTWGTQEKHGLYLSTWGTLEEFESYMSTWCTHETGFYENSIYSQNMFSYKVYKSAKQNGMNSHQHYVDVFPKLTCISGN